MKSSTHIIGGVLAALVLAKVLDIPPIQLIPAAIITSTLPDVDQKVKILRHRGQTHSLAFVAVFILVWCKISRNEIVGLIIGIASHLALDMLNGKGIELLWPMNSKNYRIMDLKYNGVVENILIGMMVVGIIWIGGKLI